MSFFTIILIAFLGAFGLALLAGLSAWVLSHGAETLAGSVDLSKKQNALLFPKWLTGLCFGSFLFLMLIQYALLGTTGMSEHGVIYPQAGTIAIQCVLGVFRYAAIVRKNKLASIFRSQALYLLYACSIILALMAWWFISVLFE